LKEGKSYDAIYKDINSILS